MKKLFLTLAVLSLTFGLASSALAASWNTRPVTVNLPGNYPAEESLQEYFNHPANDPGINVATDQTPFALWQTTSSGNSTFTLKLELTAGAATQRFGIYNDGFTGSLFQVFDGASGVNWFATATFNAGGNAGKLVVNLFDNNAIYQGQSVYNGVNSTRFGFYLELGPNGPAYFSEDDENGGVARNLAYRGTNAGIHDNRGQWWLAWEDGSDFDYQDMVVFAESINPVPEPTTLVLLGLGLGGSALGLRLRRRRS